MFYRVLCFLAVVTLLSSCELASFGFGSDSSSSKEDVMLYWSTPSERANGDSFTEGEIGGFEIRYRESDDEKFKTIVITNPKIDQFLIESIDIKNVTIEVAVFDTDGLYSDFIKATSN